jgi:DNA replication and repair protein RecF
MAFKKLEITDFRNLTSVKIAPTQQGINLFYGQNGSGKTSFLEAIYYLGLGRSLRGTQTDRIINNQAEKFAIFAQWQTINQQIIPLGLERTQDGEAKIRLAGKDVSSLMELANLIPVLLINSHCHHFLDAGPVSRRKYLDWGAFYFIPDFLRVWKRYARALKQRNAALRGQIARNELQTWNQELAEYAVLFDQYRKEYIRAWEPVFLAILAELLPLSDLELGYQQGWAEEAEYSDILTRHLDKDLQFGYTQMGPHRADLKIKIAGVPAKDILSRGQQKLFVCAMILAQGALLHRYTEKRPIYLIDDLPSELDLVSRSKLIALLSKQETQVFVTAVEREILDSFLIRPTNVFHVEHGDIRNEPVELS